MDSRQFTNEKRPRSQLSRVLDYRTEIPIIGVRTAAAIHSSDYDFITLGVPFATTNGVAIRTIIIDAWMAEYLSTYPDAVALHAGCRLGKAVSIGSARRERCNCSMMNSNNSVSLVDLHLVPLNGGPEQASTSLHGSTSRSETALPNHSASCNFPSQNLPMEVRRTMNFAGRSYGHRQPEKEGLAMNTLFVVCEMIIIIEIFMTVASLIIGSLWLISRRTSRAQVARSERRVVDVPMHSGAREK
ncbi:hypothetical protein [Nocardia sp. NPDC052112]|uniref:hypothetical protein n=1 Tax=Nocardia sp. NPDC052112 TaxID=3155646 RepID=UPI00342EBD8A